MKVQNNPFLKAKWRNRGSTKQPFLWAILLCVFYFLMPQENLAQSVRGLRNLRVDTLKKQTKSEGYVLLRNDTKLSDVVIKDIVKNFEKNKVVLGYSKRINHPPHDIQLSLIDVKEIHFEDWHLGIVPYHSKDYRSIFLTEIVFQSPKITLYRTLPHIKSINTETIWNGAYFGTGMTEPPPPPKEIKDKFTLILLLRDMIKDLRAIYKTKPTLDTLIEQKGGVEYLQKYNKNIYIKVSDTKLSSFLNDCESIAQQVSSGYYTEEQTLQMVMNYDSVSRTGDYPKERIIQEGKFVKVKPKGGSYDVGIGSGMKAFSSVFGLNANISISEKLSVRIGVGATGDWGTKSAIGLKYDFRPDMRYSKGWSLAMGYGHYLGNSVVQIGGTEGSISFMSERTDSIRIISLPTSTIHFSTLYNRYFGKNKYFFLELGYSIGLRRKPWRTEILGAKPSNVQLWDIRMIQPGGIICGIGINFIIK